MIRKFLNLYRERQPRKPKAFAQIEAQTLSGNAAALARRRHQLDKAKRDEMTERLRMEIRAGHVAKMRWPQNG